MTPSNFNNDSHDIDSIELLRYVTGELEEERNEVIEQMLDQDPDLRQEVCDLGVTSMIVEDELCIKPGGLTDRQRRMILTTLDTVVDAAPVGRAVLTSGLVAQSARRWRQAFIAASAAVLVLGALLLLSWHVQPSGQSGGYHAAMEQQISDMMLESDELAADVEMRVRWIPEEAFQSRYVVDRDFVRVVEDNAGGAGEGTGADYLTEAYEIAEVEAAIRDEGMDAAGGESFGMAAEGASPASSPHMAEMKEKGDGPLKFLLSAERAVSCVFVHRSTRGYDAMRHMIREQSQLPGESQVRIEDLINYFPYDYPSPAFHQHVGLTAELSECPWNPAHQLLRIGIKASDRRGNDKGIVAEDLGLLVDFNPARVEGYRLVGYARHHYDPDRGISRVSRDETEHSLKAGQTVTAIYEVIPVGRGLETSEGLQAEKPARRYVGLGAMSSERGRMAVDDLLTVRMLYRIPGRIDYREQEFVINNRPKTWLQMDEDFRFAAAVAGYGLLLQNPESVPGLSFNRIVQMAADGLGNDVDGRRTEFIGLVKHAALLSGESVNTRNPTSVRQLSSQ